MTYMPKKDIIITSTDYANVLGNFRTRTIGATGSHRFTFRLPDDLRSLIKAELLTNVSALAAGTDRDIDISIDAHQEGQTYNQKTVTDTTTLYDLSAYSGKTYSFNITSLLPTPTAGDIIGVFIDNNGIGGGMDYFLIHLIYNT